MRFMFFVFKSVLLFLFLTSEVLAYAPTQADWMSSSGSLTLLGVPVPEYEMPSPFVSMLVCIQESVAEEIYSKIANDPLSIEAIILVSKNVDNDNCSQMEVNVIQDHLDLCSAHFDILCGRITIFSGEKLIGYGLLIL